MKVIDKTETISFNNKKLHLSDQYSQITDAALRLAFIDFADRLDEVSRREIQNIYNSQPLMEAYESFRRWNRMNNNGYTDRRTAREIIRIPAGRVYEFLRDYFEPMYGPHWIKNKHVLCHELVRPFWIVDKL